MMNHVLTHFNIKNHNWRVTNESHMKVTKKSVAPFAQIHFSILHLVKKMTEKPIANADLAYLQRVCLSSAD